MSKIGQYIQYYVEGQDEEKILSVLKTDMQLILPEKGIVTIALSRYFGSFMGCLPVLQYLCLFLPLLDAVQKQICIRVWQSVLV